MLHHVTDFFGTGFHGSRSSAPLVVQRTRYTCIVQV